MSLLIQEHAALLARTETLEIRLATSFAEIEAAMRLRFEIFNLELQEGLLASYERGYDTDAYDAYCDHLIAVDRLSGKVIGTYRLLRQRVAERHIGFYSENEFDLTNLKKLPGELLELGRSCIAPSHRSSSVINRLWNAIIEYAHQRELQYLFGCGSLHCSEPEEVQPVFSYLRKHHFAPEEFRVWPVTSCRMEVSDDTTTADDPRQILRRLSPVMKGYLRTGALICGEPAFDAAFGTADVLVLLDRQRFAERYRQHYDRTAA